MNPEIEPPPLPDRPRGVPSPALEPPPLPVRPPSPPPPSPSSSGRKRGPARSLWLFLLVALYLIYTGPIRAEARFTDDAGHVPRDFEVTLRSGDREKKARVEEGKLHFIRFLWSEIDVTDLSYLRSVHPVDAGKLELTIERNAILKLRDAATGLPSVPQRGD